MTQTRCSLSLRYMEADIGGSFHVNELQCDRYCHVLLENSGVLGSGYKGTVSTKGLRIIAED
jgi:hypothetical protein